MSQSSPSGTTKFGKRHPAAPAPLPSGESDPLIAAGPSVQWRILTKPRTDPARAISLLRALFVLFVCSS
jgi:hypothetical protein